MSASPLPLAALNEAHPAARPDGNLPGACARPPATSDAQPCSGLVINAPEIFADPVFQRWLENDQPKFTWHRGGLIGEWSDVVVLVDPGLGGEGCDADMPAAVWLWIIGACRDHLGPAADMQCHYADMQCHYMVRLTNLSG